jgi:hypothetical protein
MSLSPTAGAADISTRQVFSASSASSEGAPSRETILSVSINLRLNSFEDHVKSIHMAEKSATRTSPGQYKDVRFGRYTST